jgi:hypothetical protein
MPKRDMNICCICTTCKNSGDLAPDGSPLGKLIPASQRIAHQRRMQLEVEATLGTQETVISDAIYLVMRDTLAPSDSNLDSQPSRLWTSRHDFQRETSLQQNPDALTCEDPPVDAILEGIQRLQVSPNDSSPDSSRYTSKSEQHQRTRTAHKVLDHIEARIASSVVRLSISPLRSVIAEVETEIVQIQVAFDNVKRNVQSVNTRKDRLGNSIIGLQKEFAKFQQENHVPDYNPLQYNSSMS